MELADQNRRRGEKTQHDGTKAPALVRSKAENANRQAQEPNRQRQEVRRRDQEPESDRGQDSRIEGPTHRARQLRRQRNAKTRNRKQILSPGSCHAVFPLLIAWRMEHLPIGPLREQVAVIRANAFLIFRRWRIFSSTSAILACALRQTSTQLPEGFTCRSRSSRISWRENPSSLPLLINWSCRIAATGYWR